MDPVLGGREGERDANRHGRVAQGTVHARFQFPYLDAAVLVRHQREMSQRLGVVPERSASAGLRAGLVQGSREQDDPAEELPVEPFGLQPRSFECLVSGPELSGFEEVDGFAPLVAVEHDRSIRPARAAPARPRGNLCCVTLPDPATARTAASKTIVVAVSGASGMAYAVDVLRQLSAAGVTTHLVVTSGAKRVLPTESDVVLADLEALATHVHRDTDLGAAVASGSFRTDGMVVVPCSAGTLAKVSQGHTDSLVTRAAHVTLKERGPLVLVVREAPYSRPMLVNMLAAHDAGAIVLPASPGFYQRPATIDDLVGTVTARVLDRLGVDNDRSPRWQGGG